MYGLYDHSGMLRYAGPGPAECLAYAELFGLADDGFSLSTLVAGAAVEMSADALGIDLATI